MNYYYLLASWPSLQLFAAPPLDREVLMLQAREQLTAKDAAELSAILAGGGSSALAARWQAFDGQLRLLVARVRAERRALVASDLHDDELPEDHGSLNLELQNQVRDAFAAEDPMERERRLDRLRWRWLESESAFDPFSSATVFTYALRFELVCAWHERSTMRGRTALAAQREQLLAGFGGMEFTMDAATESGA